MTKNDPFSLDAKKGKILKLLNKFVALSKSPTTAYVSSTRSHRRERKQLMQGQVYFSCNLEVIKPEKIIIEIFASSSWRIHISCHNPGRTHQTFHL